jgi:tRNA dimethylallyltransferase
MQLAILGPTASGKSSLAVAVARRIGGTVVNGDPFQSFAGLAIGTGQPSAEEQRGVPHVGYGFLPLTVPLNPAGFGVQVRRWLAETERPILVTGSGLYLRGIWDQLDALPDVAPRVVAQVRQWLSALGAPRLHRYLQGVDPIRAAELHPNDGSRIQRAIALYLATGQRPSQLLSGVKRGVPSGWSALLVLPSRDQLRSRIERRVRAMVEEGWQEEVQRAVRSGHEEDLRRLRPLGYVPWLEGGSIEARIILETQAYAKRQGTWFRNQLPDIPIWDPDVETLDEACVKLGLDPHMLKPRITTNNPMNPQHRTTSGV